MGPRRYAASIDVSMLCGAPQTAAVSCANKETYLDYCRVSVSVSGVQVVGQGATIPKYICREVGISCTALLEFNTGSLVC